MADSSIRPYLIVPKLIKQPTWGGDYISTFKSWNTGMLKDTKIGQSYEFCYASNLSLCGSSSDAQFNGEITTAKDFQNSTSPNSVSLATLVAKDPQSMLGEGIHKVVLIKFTQGLGNSFQLHVKDGTTDTSWKPKPESWYYFEPGIATLGVKPSIDWRMYQEVVTEIDRQINEMGDEIKSGTLDLSAAKKQISQLLQEYNPWQFVNVVKVPAEALIDLSPCGIHHSWEEDPSLPLGNILYEVQVDVTDDTSTIRNFDKGKISEDGTSRGLNIADYFKYIDRSEEANDPKTHMRAPKKLTSSDKVTLERLFETNYYILDRLSLKQGENYIVPVTSYQHVFVKEGALTVTANEVKVTAGKGHSVFIPAAAQNYTIAADKDTIALLTFPSAV